MRHPSSSCHCFTGCQVNSGKSSLPGGCNVAKSPLTISRDLHERMRHVSNPVGIRLENDVLLMSLNAMKPH